MQTEKLVKHPRAPIVICDVTRELIDTAERGSSSHCMIADAIKLARPDVKAITVDLQAIRFSDPAKQRRYIYLTPRPAQIALINFDQGNHTEPFKFKIGAGGTQIVDTNRRRNQITAARRLREAAEAAKNTVSEAEKNTASDPSHMEPGGAENTASGGAKKAKRPYIRKVIANLLGVANGQAPTFVGGNPPPTGNVTNRGKDRRFGIRHLKV